VLFNIFLYYQNFYYFCIQEVEEEAGSAGVQPVSNKLPALRSNQIWIRRSCTKMEHSFFLLLITPDGYENPIPKSLIFCKKYLNNLLSAD
jgi:hypothetical protein